MFRFVCTVDAVCRSPFDYVVLSKPGVIRRPRERKSIRVHTHLAVRFDTGETGESYEGLGLAKGISALGMSLAASWTLRAVGERLRVAFRLKSVELDTEIETTAVIRNVQKGSAPGRAVAPWARIRSTRHSPADGDESLRIRPPGRCGVSVDRLEIAQESERHRARPAQPISSSGVKRRAPHASASTSQRPSRIASRSKSTNTTSSTSSGRVG